MDENYDLVSLLQILLLPSLCVFLFCSKIHVKRVLILLILFVCLFVISLSLKLVKMSTILQGIVTKKPNKVPEKGEIFFSSEKIQEMSITMKLVIQSDKDLFFLTENRSDVS